MLEAINFTARHTGIVGFLCPSDGGPFRAVGVNYRANVGVGCYPARSFLSPDSGNGLFRELHVCRPADVTDGLSHTAAFSERLRGSGRQESVPQRDYWTSLLDGELGTADNLLVLCQASARTSYPPGFQLKGFTASGDSWFWVGRDRTTYTHTQSPNGTIPDCLLGALRTPPGLSTARGMHPGGVNVAMGDGSVRFVPDSIPRPVWRGLGSRNGAEAVE